MKNATTVPRRVYHKMPDSVQTILRRGYSNTRNGIEQVYHLTPESLQPRLEKSYYVVSPNHSWEKKRKEAKATDEFVEQFFDSHDEYQSYKEEFFQGEIRDICERALSEVEGDKRIYDAHKDESANLYALVRKRRPATVVETGVHNGISTVSILLALERNETGTLHSIDAGPEIHSDGEDGDVPAAEAAYYERGRPSCAEPKSHVLPDGKQPGWIIPDELRERWQLTVGRSRRELPALLAEVDDVSLFLHDSEHSTSGMLFEFELTWEWLEPGGVLMSLHVDQNAAFETFVDERECTHGLSSYEYVGNSNPTYDAPCSSGYAIKT
jgi:hypothetical protein